MAFVFHNIAGDGYNNSVAVPPFEGKPESYVQAATLMSRSWVSFIVNGDPNYSEGEMPDDLDFWIPRANTTSLDCC